MFASLGAAQSTQFGPEQVITTLTDGPRSVFAADLDGDGDQDVLAASFRDNKIAWYENSDGKGAFGPERVITTSAVGAFSVFAADLDGDGDQDVVSASKNDNKIAWYENTDGLGAFGPQQVISTSALDAASVFAADLDGDGDQDVLSASWRDDKIAWYENTDGKGAFGPQQVITISALSAFSVFAADLDGDGDQDVLSASAHDDKIAWYENTDGKGAFGPQRVITTLAASTMSVFAADLDGDGDQDVLSASRGDDEIAWYENTDGKGAFGPQQVITTSALGTDSVFAADLDGDGDQDVLSPITNDNKIAWYENTDAMGAFGPPQVITTTAVIAQSVFAADLNGDGNPEVLSASFEGDKISWYENLGAPAPIPEIEVAPNSISFGNRSIEAVPTAAVSVSIQNIGSSSLSFTAAQVALTGTDAAQFLIVNDTGEAALAPGAVRTVGVAFDPSTLGMKTADLTITSDDSDEPAVNVALTGEGQPPPPVVPALGRWSPALLTLLLLCAALVAFRGRGF